MRKRVHYAVSSVKIRHTGDFKRIEREDLGFLVISANDHGNIHVTVDLTVNQRNCRGCSQSWKKVSPALG
ncbi:hypothetical protein L2E82_36737 [Cichorium intybus]|uniref:Uncharacterized protein n=1 Tax=Cichorium intybus TaxID=13427 RepID=A0ACB9ACB5_CICIN|nr:hypothetical protein L2E82_36737 [Cichorium intybus]